MYALGVHAHPGCESWDEITAAVRTANGLQTYFNCTLNPLTEPLSATAKEADVDTLEERLSAATPPVTGLIFCEEQFHDSILIHEILPKRIYVSCRVAEGGAAPPFRLYLLYQIAAAALTLGAHLRPKANKEMIHRPPVGCLWDWWEGSDQRATAMMMARICPSCRNDLKTQGNLPDEGIVAARQILEYIRRSMLGESPTIANRVFIAYGSAPDWDVLRSMLKHWGLDPEYFNREVVTELIADRWKQMIDQSRFAFAVMTPDDQLADGKYLARQNVIHEIGLCHARLGLSNTAILLAEGTAKFTNADGVNHIGFQPGHLAATAEKIHQLLIERGLLDPSHPMTLPPGLAAR
jgi:hypothetical protein